jgi:hypothetical protein
MTPVSARDSSTRPWHFLPQLKIIAVSQPGHIEGSKPSLNWNTEAGEALLALVEALPRDRNYKITVFGSAPLQLSLDASFLSADVDIFSEDDFSSIIQEHKLGKNQRQVYIEQCAPNIFSAGPDWPLRSYTEQIKNVTFCFPRAIDILVSKLSRLEQKDENAFKLVFEKTGMPTEEQLKQALMNAVDLFKPPFDEEKFIGDIRANTVTIWQLLYHKQIDVREEIIKPALEKRRAGYGLDVTKRKDTLNNL